METPIPVEKLLEDLQFFHSEYQIDNFITIRASGTAFGQYKQALRELHGRWRSLNNLVYELEMAKIDIDEFERADLASLGEFDARRHQLKLAKRKGDLTEIERTIADTEREIKRFYAQAVALKKVVGDLTPERRQLLEKGLWADRLRSMLATDYVVAGRPRETTLELLASCTEDVKRPLLEQIETKDGVDGLIKGFYDGPPILPLLE